MKKRTITLITLVHITLVLIPCSNAQTATSQSASTIAESKINSDRMALHERLITLKTLATEMEQDVAGKEALLEALKKAKSRHLPVTSELEQIISEDAVVVAAKSAADLATRDHESQLKDRGPEHDLTRQARRARFASQSQLDYARKDRIDKLHKSLKAQAREDCDSLRGRLAETRQELAQTERQLAESPASLQQHAPTSMTAKEAVHDCTDAMAAKETLTALIREMELDIGAKGALREALEESTPFNVPIPPDVEKIIEQEPEVRSAKTALDSAEQQYQEQLSQFGELDERTTRGQKDRDVAATALDRARSNQVAAFRAEMILQARMNHQDAKSQLGAIRLRLAQIQLEIDAGNNQPADK